jgi:hypothetical protein
MDGKRAEAIGGGEDRVEGGPLAVVAVEHPAIGAEGEHTLEGVEPLAGDLHRAGVEREQPSDQEVGEGAQGPALEGNPGVGVGAACEQLGLEAEERASRQARVAQVAPKLKKVRSMGRR